MLANGTAIRMTDTPSGLSKRSPALSLRGWMRTFGDDEDRIASVSVKLPPLNPLDVPEATGDALIPIR